MNSTEHPRITGPPTPAFVIDKSALDLLVNRFQDALAKYWPNSVMSYSVKTNPLPWLLTYMKQQGVWAEVVSDSEYRLVLRNRLRTEPDRVQRSYQESVQSSVLPCATVHSPTSTPNREVRWAVELAEEDSRLDVRVGLRVNWDLEALCPGESTVNGEMSRFGFDYDQWRSRGGDLTVI